MKLRKAIDATEHPERLCLALLEKRDLELPETIAKAWRDIERLQADFARTKTADYARYGRQYELVFRPHADNMGYFPWEKGILYPDLSKHDFLWRRIHHGACVAKGDAPTEAALPADLPEVREAYEAVERLLSQRGMAWETNILFIRCIGAARSRPRLPDAVSDAIRKLARQASGDANGRLMAFALQHMDGDELLWNELRAKEAREQMYPYSDAFFREGDARRDAAEHLARAFKENERNLGLLELLCRRVETREQAASGLVASDERAVARSPPIATAWRKSNR